jgi:cytochrome c
MQTIVNTCIKKGLNGKALKNKSVEMQSIVLYIKGLGNEKKPVVRKAPVGCRNCRKAELQAMPRSPFVHDRTKGLLISTATSTDAA